MTARNKRSRRAQEANEADERTDGPPRAQQKEARDERSHPALAEPLRPAATDDHLAGERRFGALRALAFSTARPPALRSYASGAATPMTLLRAYPETGVPLRAIWDGFQGW